MIQGKFFINTDVAVTLDTGSILTDASEVNILVKFQNGTVKTYEGEVVDFTKITSSIPAEDNIQPGTVSMQAQAEFDDSGVAQGETEQLVILDSFAVTE